MRAHQGCHGAYPAALFDAVSAYQPDLLAALIGDAGNWRGVNAHGCNLLGWWAMDATGEANWPNALRNLDILEGYGFVVNAVMEEGRTALWLACRHGALLQAEWLVSHYAWELNAQDDDGCVPLAALVAARFPERYGETMTPEAFRARRDALAVAMVRQGARLDLADRDGGTPLSRCTTVALRTLLERTARAVEKAVQKS